MTSFNFEPQDIALCTKYDGFIDKLGNYYIVKERRKSSLSSGHNEWAEQYMKHNKLNLIGKTYSMLLSLSKLRCPADYLIHCFGFAYYSHDSLLYKPIIMLPNPNYFGNRATSEQIETLFQVMLFNKENPYNKEILIDSNIYEYSGLDEEIGGRFK